MSRRWLGTFVLSLLLAAELAGAEEFHLVRDGRTVSTIVLAANPAKGAQLAAFELQKYIRLMTGATLPIARENEPVSGARILVGESEHTKNLKILTAGLKRQEHIIRVVKNDLVLLGPDKEIFGSYEYPGGHPEWQGLRLDDELGTPYAVFTFLEKFGGVRWYWPGDDGEVVPARKDFAVPADTNLRLTPAMDFCRFNMARTVTKLWVNPFRPETIAPEWQPGAFFPDQPNIFYRLRNKDGRGVIADNHSVLLRSYLKRGFDKTQPDFWGANKPAWENQLCLSNPKLIDQVANDIIDIFAGRDPVAPGLTDIHLAQWQREVAVRQVSLTPEDNGSWCRCDRCRTFVDPADEKLHRGSLGFSTGTHSRYVWTFVSRIASKVKAARPDVKIVCDAYWSYFYPPANLTLPDNVLVPLCLQWSFHNQPEVADYEYRAMAAWSRLAPGRTAVYAYYLFPDAWTMTNYERDKKKLAATPPWFLGFSAPRMLGRALKQAAEHAARGFTAELADCPPGGGKLDNLIWNHLNLYITWKLSENPRLDMDALLKEYYRLFYGPAEAPMAEFWDGLEELWLAGKSRADLPVLPDESAFYTGITERIGRLQQALGRARTSVDRGSVYAKRLDLVTNGVLNVLTDSLALHTWPLRCDFENRPSTRFVDILGAAPAGLTTGEKIGELPANQFLRLKGCSIVCLLPTPLKVGGNLATIEVRLRVRNIVEGNPAAVYLTSLAQPEGGTGHWYRNDHPEDTGFGFGGYQYDNHANSLEYRSAGKVLTETKNQALLPRFKEWHSLRLVWDRKARTLTLYRDGNSIPVLTKPEVNLEGALFRGLWFRGYQNDYDDIEVNYTTEVSR